MDYKLLENAPLFKDVPPEEINVMLQCLGTEERDYDKGETIFHAGDVIHNIGLVLTGYLEVPTDGIYTFALLSDDGSTLKLDGELLGDNDGAHSPVEIIVQKALKAGLHPMEVRYFDCNGGVLQMELVNDKGEKTVLPKEWLKHE